MSTVPFNDHWTFLTEADETGERVTLPHDAMVHEPRSADAPAWAHGAYFPGGRYRYRKTWSPSADLDGKQISLRFEGVYRHSRVLIDGQDVGGSISGYAEFDVRLDPHLTPGATHVLEVTVDNSATPNSRWYTGSGIYRPVWLDVRDAIHIRDDGISFRTVSTGNPARATVRVELANPAEELVEVSASLRRAGKANIDLSTLVSGGVAEFALTIPDPDLWSDIEPALYDLDVIVRSSDEIVDSHTARVGLRTMELDGKNGLRINGRPVLLRGANVHHDSGILGAATFHAAERRRIRLLKEAGFNAIRSAHNPASRALLDACDELGVYVMDELYDGWYDHKTDHDDAETFEDQWRIEMASLVARDRNRPSVLMYSIGNENGEALTPRGRRLAKTMADTLRTLDPDRAVTIGVNMVAATFAGLAGSATKEEKSEDAKGAPDMTSTSLNVISNKFGTLMKILPRIPVAGKATRELFTSFDIAGYNYGTVRYAPDAKQFPERVMVGTESMPGDIAQNWALVEKLPGLIGDFMWAGWDYLGEAGGGSWAYGTKSAPYLKPYPQLTSGTGALDITGQPGAPMFLAQATWGLLDAPAITVRPLDVPAGPVAKTSWRSTDAVPSWSWHGHEGCDAEIEVYSAAPEVEVFLNGRSLGRRPAGPERAFLARFTTPYEAGVLEAIEHRANEATTRAALSSASDLALRVSVDRQRIEAGGQDLAYLSVELSDERGVVDSSTAETISVSIDGPGVLAGLGTGASSTEETFVDSTHTLYRGRALAVVRSTSQTGPVRVLIASREHGSVWTEIEVVPNGTSDFSPSQRIV